MGNEAATEIAKISDSYSTAKSKVAKMKEEYGDGVSTRIIIYNDTDSSLQLSTTIHESGRWCEKRDAISISSRKHASFFHCKKDSTACGSCGYIQYTLSNNVYCYIGFNQPYSGTNRCGIRISKGSLSNASNVKMRSTSYDSDDTNFGYSGSAQIMENTSSPLIYYKICGRYRDLEKEKREKEKRERERREKLEKELRSAKQETKSLKDNLHHLKEQKQILSTKEKDLKQELAQKESDLMTRKQKTNDLESAVKNAKMDIEREPMRKQELEMKCKELQMKTTQMDISLIKLQENVMDIESLLKEEKIQKKDLKNILESAQSGNFDFTMYEKRIETLKGKYEHKLQDIFAELDYLRQRSDEQRYDVMRVRQKKERLEWTEKRDNEMERKCIEDGNIAKRMEIKQETEYRLDEAQKQLTQLEDQLAQKQCELEKQEMTIDAQKEKLENADEIKQILKEAKDPLLKHLEEQKNKVQKLEQQQQIQEEEEKQRIEMEQLQKEKEEEELQYMMEKRIQKRNEMERLMRCHPSKYAEWATDDLLYWIMGLNDGLYFEYKNDLETVLNENNINGQWLLENNINYKTFEEWGIKSERHCFGLFEHISSAELQYQTGIATNIQQINVLNIKKVLVICVGIAYYLSDEYPDLDSDNKNEDDVANDMRNYREVFGEYGWTVIPRYDEVKYAMTDDELNTFLVECRDKICSSHDRTQLFYEAVILTFGGHGNQHGIICSNGKTMSWRDIRAIFCDKLICNIPRIYMIDTCRVYDADAKISAPENGAIGQNVLTSTIMANSEGHEVKGGMLSKWITNAFKTNMNKNKTFGELCDIAKKDIKDASGQILTFTEDDKECDKIIFKPNDKTRGRIKEKSEHTKSSH